MAHPRSQLVASARRDCVCISKFGVMFRVNMAPHSTTLAWEIPWMEEAGGLQSMGSLRVGHD